MAISISDQVFRVLGELRYEPTRKRVRALLGGETVVDSLRAVVLWEPARSVPMYAVPRDDVPADLVPSPARAEPPPSRPFVTADGTTMYDPRTPFAFHTAPGTELDVRCGAASRPAAAFALDDPDLEGYVVFDFPAFDWLEEDEPIVGHPRQPFGRIDILRSSREVRIEHDGQLLARSTRALMLFEGSSYLPVRYYLPPEDVLVPLEPSELTTTCAYKGHASYWSAAVEGAELANIAWSYPEPLAGVERIAGRIAFFNERVDVFVDGVQQKQPVTPWS